MDAEVSARLRHRHPAFPDKLDRLDLELSAELPSLHDHLRLDKTPNLGVHQTGSCSLTSGPWSSAACSRWSAATAMKKTTRRRRPRIAVRMAPKRLVDQRNLPPGSVLIDRIFDRDRGRFEYLGDEPHR